MKKTPATDDSRNLELVPDAWPRFEKFIREIAKAGPQHRTPAAKPKAKAGNNSEPVETVERLVIHHLDGTSTIHETRY